MPVSPDYRPSTSHAVLGAEFFDIVAAAEFPQHILRHRNRRWAAQVGLDTLTEAEWVDHFGRFQPLPGSFPQPLALRYHGHQFRSYNPEIGDGRGFLFAQLYDRQDGRLLDLGTKGSGRTPWSRTADGRLTLKGGVREVLATEMLEALGVETSKSFSLIETGEALQRGDEPSPTRSSVLVRLSHSHVRIGTFQRLAAFEQVSDLEALLDYTVETYLPEARRDVLADRAIAFLEAVIQRVARMGAQWMLAGFVHGVLNTDNINVTGESFDYGPWRFLPILDPQFTAAYFDQTGLYAYGRQPDALLWNLTRLAECLLPFAPASDLETALGTFEPAMQAEFAAATLRRLGLHTDDTERSSVLAQTMWKFLRETKAPFEQVWFDLYGGAARLDKAFDGPARAFYADDGFAAVRAAMERIEPAPATRLEHAYFSDDRPCTMLIDEVEALWAPIAAGDDWAPLQEKLAAIERMAQAYGRAAEA